LPAQIRRTSFLAVMIFAAFMLYPVRKKSIKKTNYVPWYDFLLAVMGSGSYLYFAFNFRELVERAGIYTTTDIIIGAIGILILMEICRRVVGLPILCIVSGFILYAFLNGYSIKRIVGQLFYTMEGVIGTPLGVCSTFIVLFIIFAAFLDKTGIGKFFIDLANSIAGSATGGPAKVAVIASGLQGMISGSSVANTVGSGSFTIPMMKKTGYKPEFAAAVEASASTGGQIMPPIMGAAAFLMAEMTGIPYSTIVIAAIIPAVLYFTGIFLMIHFEAKKLGLKGLPKETLPNFFKLFFSRGYLLLPLILLIVTMMNGVSTSRAALLAILCSIVVSMFRKDTRLNPTKFFDALEQGTKGTISVAIACAVAGIIVGVVTLTGLGIKLAAGMLALSGGIPIIALFFTMIACIILGMGVPTTANYVIMATITAPIVVELGIPLMAAHMFVFYFGIVADITPPVALAAYAGSAIAKCNPMKAAFTATRLAITAFLIPYIFAFSPDLLLVGAEPLQAAQNALTAFIGMVGIAAGMEGYMRIKINVVERILLLAGGLLMIIPGLLTDLIGVALILGIFLLQTLQIKKAAIA
ncbi:MAG: TRAP transporter permease, partial [Firmicutes bacterium]|nr:TRAP transporter permease [Bacillota bacterium]